MLVYSGKQSRQEYQDDIASLVEKGLESSIQKALDIVRVIGRNAVHPGELNIKDDKATAIALLNFVNPIVDRRIAAKKSIDEMFKNLPKARLRLWPNETRPIEGSSFSLQAGIHRSLEEHTSRLTMGKE